MKYLRITNSGEMDINALFLMGASNKEGDSSKIGFFGSGNKYALTTLLRKGVDVRIFSGITEFKLSLKDASFRGETFQQVFIDDQPTSFTTRMGPQWEEWMALREFICNAKDEGGYELECVGMNQGFDGVGISGETWIFVEMTPVVEQFYEEITEFIIDESIDIVESFEDSRLMESDVFSIYRKGIRCSVKSEKKALFAYDFDNLSINESRVFDREWEMKSNACKMLRTSKNESVVKKVLQMVQGEDRDYFEYNLYWDNFDYSKTWEKELSTGKFIFSETSLKFLPAGESFGQIVLPDTMCIGLQKCFPTLKWYGNFDKSFFLLQGSEEEKEKLEKADNEIVSYGFNKVELFIVKFFESEVLATAIDGVIRIDKDYLMKADYDELCSTLLEEHEHIDGGYRDGTRHFEQHLCMELVLARRKINLLKEELSVVFVDDEKARLLSVVQTIKNTLGLL